MSEAATKECPFCAETIKAAAVLCRFCGRELPPPVSVTAPAPVLPPAAPADAVLLEQSEILELLTALVQKSLVVYEEGEHGRGGFRLLQTVRQYAGERLLEGSEAAAVRTRHADFFLEWAERAEPELWGADQAEWFDRLETEHDNLRTALEWLAANSEAEGALRLAGALRRLWSVRGYCAEGRARLAAVLALPGASEHPAARATALYAGGILAAQQGDGTAARSLHEQSLALRRQLGDRAGMALSLIYLGQVLFLQGDHAAAQAVYEESLALGRELGDNSRIAFSLHQLGQVAFFRGDYEGARSFYEESLGMRREHGERLGMTECLEGLAGVLTACGQAEHATRLYGAAAMARELLASPLPPHERASRERDTGSLKAVLGEERFAVAWAEGRALSLEEAAILALSGANG